METDLPGSQRNSQQCVRRALGCVETHPHEALLKSRIRTQRVPLRCDSDLDETRLVRIDRLSETAQRRVIQVAKLTVEERPLERGKILCLCFEHPSDDTGPAADGVHLF